MTRRNSVSSAEDALAYLCECELATIDQLSMLKRHRAGDWRRQISIAQAAIDWIIQFRAPLEKGTRVSEVVFDHNRSVESYAEAMRKRHSS